MVSASSSTPHVPAVANEALERWIQALARERDTEEIDYLRAVGHFALRTLDGATGEDQRVGIGHALAVAGIVADLNLDRHSLAAALLYGAVADGGTGLDEVRDRFGDTVARLVDGVRRMDSIREHQQASGADPSAHGQAESLRRMLLAMVEDVRVVLIKLAVRLHNMRLLKDLADDPERRAAARETLDIFAPLANRLSVWQLKWELEDLSFRYLEPHTYRLLARRLAERRVDRERYLRRAVTALQRELAANGIMAEVSSRPKHLFSIWRKMQRKGVDFDQVFDVRAVRILVAEVRDCYAALGVVHGIWQHIAREFDDYIANPKQNLYRSLHTAVVGPEGRTLEVQIRTHEMHQHAEFGVAAHWRYKEGVGEDAGFERRINWMRQLLEWKEEVADATELLDHFKSESAEDRVYVFTPQGRVVDLPVGATPLDFAYRIHTDVGHRCRGAKVNGRIVPLSYKLASGEQVEILTTKQGKPGRDWLNPHLGYLTTARARSKVRRWFAEQDHEKNLATGRAVLERELHRLGISAPDYGRLAERFHLSKVDELLVAIGRGDVSTTQIVNALSELHSVPADKPASRPASRRPQKAGSTGDVRIEGVGDLLTQMAKCCKPLPNDPIVGYITRGRGVTIHRATCANVLRMTGEHRARLIAVEWASEASAEHSRYPVDIQIRAFDRAGLLRDITSLLANEKINVVALNTVTDRREHMAHMTVRVEINGLDQLDRVLAKLAELPNVVDVKRQL